MPPEYDRLIADFKDRWENEDRSHKVKYRDNGDMKVETDTEFSTISTVIQDRGYVYKDELLAMSRWKVEGKRNDRHIKKNTDDEVESITGKALNTTDAATAASILSDLDGDRIPVASTILAMSNPYEYAIVDFRSFRALAAVVPSLVDTDCYDSLVEFLEAYRTYANSPTSYEYYMKHVREIASTEGLTPREVDMALWTLDKNLN